ncbi:hypothetical protein FRC09_003892, partial [Ceratobasidium sp. 395]
GTGAGVPNRGQDEFNKQLKKWGVATESKIVRLSNLKFAERWANDPTQRSGADLRFAAQESTEPRRIDTFAPLSRTHSYGPQEVPPPAPPKFKHEDDFKDHLSKDNPGSELSKDATIWKLYLDEAEEYDQELVKGRHASLDVLLLFAALFSAILTTFLVESKNLLQQDPADTSVALLLLIAQRQAGTISNNTPNIEIPSFAPSTSALWINGLWMAGARALAALAPVILKRWMAIKVPKSGTDPNLLQPTASTPDLDSWPEVDSNLDVARLEGAIATQLLLVIRTLGPHLLRAGAINLVEAVLAELHQIVVASPYSAYLSLRANAARDFSSLLEFAAGSPAEGHAVLSSTSKAHIVKLLTFEITGKQPYRRTHLPPQLIPHLLLLLRDSSFNEATMKAALKYVVDRVRDTHGNINYLRTFTHSDQGYSSLVAIGLIHEEHIESIVNSILQITHVAVTSGHNARNSTPIALNALAAPGFLDAISLVTRHTVKMIDRQTHRHLHTFGRNMMTALHRIEPSAARVVLEHGALDEVVAGLQAQQARSNSTASGSGSGSGVGTGTGRNGPPSTEFLLSQLRTLKEERLPELAARYEQEGDDERRPQEEATGQAI